MKCPNCGIDNAVGEEFCANCGAHLYATNDSTIASMTNNAAPMPTPNTTEQSTSTGSFGNSTTLFPNAQLEHGRYVVDKILGQGGMGAAVLARDTRVSNKRVVIKELISDETDPEQRQEDVRNFEREVEMLAQLDHPLVPTVTDSFQENSRSYMVQEYAPGENLEDYLERVKQPMAEQEALTYISQVLDILDYLGNHQPPVVHRDIKPANIIISSKDKRARLVDFGIARADEAKHAKRKQTTALGTPGYAPPEQYQGNADTRSDVYALAATLHHLVTNRDPRNFPPFNYPSARSLNPQVSPELDRVLTKALAIDVKNRYQSASDLKHEIDTILQQRYHTTTGDSSYLLNTSRPLKAATPEDLASYGQGYRPTRDVHPTDNPHSGAPRPTYPSYANPRPVESSPYSGPLGGFGGQQQQQQQMYRPEQRHAPYSGQQYNQFGAPQQGSQTDNKFILYSFLLLVAVVVLIGIFFFLIPVFQAPVAPPPVPGPAQPIN